MAGYLEFAIACAGSALSGGLATVLVSPVINRRKNKLDEAKIVQELYSRINDDLEARDREQTEKISKLRTVIISLTDILNAVFPKIDGITADEKKRLLDASIEARLTGLAA